jgi:hypothetical protein
MKIFRKSQEKHHVFLANLKRSAIAFFLCILIVTCVRGQQGHFKIRTDEYIQVGYDNYKALSFGIGGSATMPNNGQMAIEYWNDGFNMFRPWPQSSWGNYKLFVRAWDGFVGIGKYPTVKLDVEGDVKSKGVLLTSDMRLKRNISNLNSSNCLDKIMQLQSVTYNYRYDKSPYQGPLPSGEELTEIKLKTIEAEKEDLGEQEAKILRHGFIAQDMKEILPDLVREDESGFYSVDYIGVIPVLVEAMKEQQTQINALKAELTALKNK